MNTNRFSIPTRIRSWFLVALISLTSAVFVRGRFVPLIHRGQERDSITYPLTDFTRISLGAGVKVTITKAKEFRVTTRGDKEIVKAYVPFVKDNQLQLKYSGRQDGPKKPHDIEVMIELPQLRDLNLHGKTESVIRGFEGDSLDFFLSGRSKAIFSSDYAYAWVMVSGNSSLAAYELHLDHAVINISANSSCELSINNSIRGNVSNGGHLYYKGDVRPGIISSQGSVTKVK